MQNAGNKVTKLSRKLLRKKGRQEEGKFLVCGRKSINEAIIAKGTIEYILLEENNDINFDSEASILYLKKGELAKLSPLEALQDAMAICKIPETKAINYNKSALVCDAISDPGNMGTIIRLCDWFGIKQLILGENCVDAFNSKCVQASMGSIFRVDIKTVALQEFYKNYQHPILLAAMDGEDMRNLKLNGKEAALVLGSESHGITQFPIAEQLHYVGIPRIGKAESLNVATAGAILLSHLALR